MSEFGERKRKRKREIKRERRRECVFCLLIYVREREKEVKTSPQNLSEKRSNLFTTVKPALVSFLEINISRNFN